MITGINLSPSIPTEALKSSEIGLPDTPVIWTIYIAPDVDNNGNDILYNSDGEVGPSYEKVEEEGDINLQEEDILDTRI